MKTKYKTKNKHMEESRGVYTLPVLYNEQSGTNEGVCVRKELGVVVAIDNEDEFKGVFQRMVRLMYSSSYYHKKCIVTIQSTTHSLLGLWFLTRWMATSSLITLK